METYEVNVTTQARKQIAEYTIYIRDELYSPLAARKFIRDLYAAIKTLESMPKRLNLVDEEP